MNTYKGDWDPKRFQDTVDYEFEDLVLSKRVADRITRSAHRSRGPVGWLIDLLTTEIVISVPQLAAALVIVLVVAGAYWHQTFSVNERLLLLYQKPTTEWVVNGFDGDRLESL